MDYVICIVNDTSLPIAQRKGARSCTNHPVSDFVSYQHLSSPYRSFVKNKLLLIYRVSVHNV
jgi:hypothetical protein